MNEHHIYSFMQQMNDEGLVVLNEMPGLLNDRETFAFPGIIVCVNQQGYFNVRYDMADLEFHQHDIAILLPNHMVSIEKSSEDAMTTFVMISPFIADEIKNEIPNIYNSCIEYNWHPHFHLEDMQYENIINLLKLLDTTNRSTRESRILIIKRIMSVLFLLLKEYKSANHITSNAPSCKEALFNTFYHNITIHYSKSREVKFYSDLQCLSPKYFSKAIKDITGISALEWINNYVILQAKLLLNTSQKLSIQQISNMLGFTDQSSFCRLFKKKTGIAPQEFRKRR